MPGTILTLQPPVRPRVEERANFVKGVLVTPSFGVEEKVKSGVRLELALPWR